MKVNQSMSLDEFMRESSKDQQGPYTARADEVLMSVREYAAKVGKTPCAITKQLAENRLSGVKIGTKWMVRVIDPSKREESEEIKRLRAENIRLNAIIDVIRNAVVEKTALKETFTNANSI